VCILFLAERLFPVIWALTRYRPSRPPHPEAPQKIATYGIFSSFPGLNRTLLTSSCSLRFTLVSFFSTNPSYVPEFVDTCTHTLFCLSLPLLPRPDSRLYRFLAIPRGSSIFLMGLTRSRISSSEAAGLPRFASLGPSPSRRLRRMLKTFFLLSRSQVLNTPAFFFRASFCRI